MGCNVLVTGGAGYIGAHACKVLAAAGHLPVAYDNLVTGHRRAVRWGPFVEADVGDSAALQRALRQHAIEAVVHFAGCAYVGESMVDPGKYFRGNVVNAVGLLDAMVQAGVRRIVFSSTCATYGLPQRVPIGEEHPQVPASPYGESKYLVERLLRWYDEIHEVRFAALRYFNAAGADPDGHLGEDHVPETHLIPLALDAALGLRPHLDIYGTDYPTPDGTAVRDYVHVSDLAQAHVAALERLLAGAGSLAANLGTGRGYSVREIVAAVERISGRRVPAREAPRRPGDPPALVAACDLAREILGWQPRHSDIDTIVATAWRWHHRRAAGGRRAAAVAGAVA